MHTSILTRSIISIASLAIGSVALAAVPATAAPASSVTRDLVLEAAQTARSGGTNVAANSLAEHVCAPQEGETLDRLRSRVVDDSDDVDGLLVKAAYFTEGSDSSEDLGVYRYCAFAAFATANSKTTFTGTVALVGLPSIDTARPSDTTLTSSPMSGDVAVTEPVDEQTAYVTSATATGDVVKTTGSTTTTSRTITPKTTQQRYAAKKTRNSTVSSARKAYVKAVKKAGSSASRKAAAKRAYLARKKTANATYRAALVGTLTIVTATTPTTGSSPFDLTIYGGCLRTARC